MSPETCDPPNCAEDLTVLKTLITHGRIRVVPASNDYPNKLCERVQACEPGVTDVMEANVRGERRRVRKCEPLWAGREVCL